MRNHNAADFVLAPLRVPGDAGTHALYGTDLASGPLPVGVSPREIEPLMTVGVSREDVCGAVSLMAAPRALRIELEQVLNRDMAEERNLK